MKLKKTLCFLAALMAFNVALAQSNSVKDMRRHVKRGNHMMVTGQRDKAYEHYKKAYQIDSLNTLVDYNLATSMFPDEWKIMPPDAGRDSTMSALFTHAADPHAEDNRVRRSQACHNLGVMHQIRANQSGDDQQKYQELVKAIDYYKNALRNNPRDDEARYNLVLCQRQLPKNQGNDNQQSGQDKQQDKQDKQEQQDKQELQQQPQPQQQPQQPQQQEQQPDQQWIEQMLNAAEQREKQTRRRLDEHQQQPARRQQKEKNW